MELEEDTRECKSDSEKCDKETEESDRTPTIKSKICRKRKSNTKRGNSSIKIQKSNEDSSVQIKVYKTSPTSYSILNDSEVRRSERLSKRSRECIPNYCELEERISKKMQKSSEEKSESKHNFDNTVPTMKMKIVTSEKKGPMIKKRKVFNIV